MKTLAACATIALGLATATAAGAHVTGMSRGDYTPSGSLVKVELAMRADEAALAAGSPKDLVRDIAVSADGDACAPRFDGSAAEAPDGLRVRATFSCPRAPSRLHVRFGFLDRLPGGHRHLATVHLPGGDVDALAVLARPDLDVDVAPAGPSGPRVAWMPAAVAAAIAALGALAAGALRSVEARRRRRA